MSADTDGRLDEIHWRDKHVYKKIFSSTVHIGTLVKWAAERGS